MTAKPPKSQPAKLQLKSPVIVALDFASADDALALAAKLDPSQCRLKVGKELFTVAGPALVERLQALDFDVFLDLKFHDIPNTTAQAVLAAARLGVWMVNVHAAAGREALTTCAERLVQSGLPTKLIAVTVLTSMDDTGLQDIGVPRSAAEQVQHLAKLTQDCGLHGVVCSAQEASQLKADLGKDFLLVTPGIRMASDASDDQKRICTPSQALELGADYLVIGRSITKADDPQVALEAILQSIS